MYHRSDKEVAYIAISCSGPSEGVIQSSPAGFRRSRDGADLAFTTADGQFFHNYFLKNSDSDGAFEEHEDKRIHLINPSVQGFEEAIRSASRYLSQYIGTEYWRGGGISICYAGHGAQDTGALVLRDGNVSGKDLAEMIAANVTDNKNRRGVDLILDSCFAGAFLAHFPSTKDIQRLALYDVHAASLHNELAWELPSLGHGALTFTLKNPSNAHVTIIS